MAVRTVDPVRLLAVSDIHGNLAALESVLRDAGDFDAVVCVGDVVGYGPRPGECIGALSGLGFSCVLGNHDQAVISADTSGMNPYAAAAIDIHRRLLNTGHTTWLQKLRKSLSMDEGGVRIAVFHGSPDHPTTEYVYPSEAQVRAGPFFEATRADLLLLGHTHVPYIHRYGGRVLLNPGSVGQPRDGIPHASYMLIDLENGCVEVSHRRAPYDIEKTVEQMRLLSLPEPLAYRLFLGR
ncbi:MAG: metallophosphoesterase family protein [Candidatus Bathyarchaeota archaeon]|nr:MAG: metallophosphoesterase family protein [Candidatus Bathyarchaeota archaeon]